MNRTAIVLTMFLTETNARTDKEPARTKGYPVEYPDTIKIRFDEELPAWNYRAIPHDSDRPVMRRGISVALDTGEVVGTSFV